MVKADNTQKFNQLRKEYPVFAFEGFDMELADGGILIRFHFNAGNSVSFSPAMYIKSDAIRTGMMSEPVIRSMVFHIGMVELISYWKAFCSPEIRIKPFLLDEEQQQWWKHLFLHGLGEFFYTNGIQPDMHMLFNFSFPDGAPQLPAASDQCFNNEAVIIPVGGGKDSVVTIELLRRNLKKTYALAVNPGEASRRVINLAGFRQDEVITINREIDHNLLRLNELGFLNGHTPFSALLAFVSSFAAFATGINHIALSNESSANEPSIPGTTINHQYSKSFAFEKDFRNYYRKYIWQHNDYFSFLRPLNEIQISGLFAGFKQYHHAFRSCNAGSKNDIWCCNCPKCLFTCIMLAPFCGREKVIHIMQEDLLDKISLAPLLDQLSGKASSKPFECVGTIQEVNAALSAILSHEKKKESTLPALLLNYKDQQPDSQAATGSMHDFIEAYDHGHFLGQEFNDIIRSAIRLLHK